MQIGAHQSGAEALEQILHGLIGRVLVEPVTETLRVRWYLPQRSHDLLEQKTRGLGVAFERELEHPGEPAAGRWQVIVAVRKAVPHATGRLDHVHLGADCRERLADRGVLPHRDHDRARRHRVRAALAV